MCTPGPNSSSRRNCRDRAPWYAPSNSTCGAAAIRSTPGWPYRAKPGREWRKLLSSILDGLSESCIPATFQMRIGGPPQGDVDQVSYILFHDADGSISLDDAMTALRVRGLVVRKVANGENASLLISWRDKPAFAVTLNRGPQVLPTSKALGEGSPFAEAFGRCNARLEISTWPGMGETRDGQTTLTTLHAALMDETRGILYTMRDKQLSGPK